MPAVTPTPVPLFSGTFPDPSDRSTYGIRGRAMWLYETATAVPGINTVAAQTLANALYAQEMAEMAAAIDNFAGNWADLTGALAVPAAVYHDDEYWVLLENLADVTAEEPSLVSTVWTIYEDTAVQRTGDTMTGHLNVPSGATGTQVPRANEVMSIVGGAQLPTWATAGRPGSPATGRFGFNTDLGCIEHWNGTYWIQDGWQSSGLITLTGSQVDVTVPAWAREISVDLYNSASTSASNYIVQLGTGAGIVSTNYKVFSNEFRTSTVQDGINSTNGFLIPAAGVSGVDGTLSLRRSASNLWVGHGGFIRGTNAALTTQGTVDLGAVVTTVRILRTAGTWSGTAYVSWTR